MTNPIVIAEKIFHKGQLFGHISNGGGLVIVSHGYALKFTALNDNFVVLQVVHAGIGKEIKQQSWVKSKKVVEKKPKMETSQVTLSEEIKKEELI